jgi:UDP-GlcNAc:undecaprenyl-phosphate GlcNAc-1-phosphate transferase
MVGVVADVLLVSAAFICAYQLRFETGVNPRQAEFITEVLPFVVLVKIPIFYVMGLYRGVWRYAGMPELVRVVKATLLASIGVVLTLSVLYGADSISKGVIVIDWMIVTIAVVAVRFSFRAFPRYIATKRLNGKRVLLYGAGDAGMLALSEIRQNPGLDFQPIGFIDDDLGKVGNVVQGMPIFGTWAELVGVCSQHHIEEVLITTNQLDGPRIRETQTLCASIGLPCRLITVRFGEPEIAMSVSQRFQPTVVAVS